MLEPLNRASVVCRFAHLQDLDLPADPSGSPEGRPQMDSRLREDIPRDWPERCYFLNLAASPVNQSRPLLDLAQIHHTKLSSCATAQYT